MSRKHTHNLLGTVCFLALFGLVFIANGCAQTEASSAPEATDAVMKAIHEYGRGHSGLLSPAGTTKPTETEADYHARIGKLLVQEDFAQLEKIAQQNRAEKGRVLGGLWKTYVFYDGTSTPVSREDLSNADYAQQIARVKKWIAAYPDSTTARLAHAYLYMNFAGHARGTGLADTVSESQWGDYNSRTAQAKAILLEAATLKEKDPAWFYAMQIVALNEGWDRVRARELLEQAVAFEPDYYHYYRAYANYILPQWYGESGELLILAEEVSRKIPEPNGSMVYFRMISSIACYCQEAVQELPKINYPKVRLGYNNVTRLYGASNLNANRFAYMAGAFQDRPSAKEAFAEIRSMEPQVWYKEQVFDAARQWANTQ